MKTSSADFSNMQRRLDRPYTVVARDTAFANLIREWGPEIPPPRRLCAEGPAVDLLSSVWPGIPNLSLDKALVDAEVLISGTGSGDLEHTARCLAGSKGIFNIAVIDHWANYDRRFKRQNTIVLPDLIIVTDALAEELAQKHFPRTPIERWPNLYLDNQVNQVNAKQQRVPHVPPDRLLVVMSWNLEGTGEKLENAVDEFDALDYLLSNLSALCRDPATIEIRLRPHPSEQRRKYDRVVTDHPDLRMHIALPGELSGDIAWADMVAGTHSYAMVVAVVAGRPTICTIPSGGPDCLLPFPEIMYLRDLTEDPVARRSKRPALDWPGKL